MVLWGSLFPMVKLGYTAFGVESVGDILFFAGIRFTICGAIITVFAYFTDNQFVKSVKDAFFPILLSGLFAIILHYGCTYAALKLTDSSKTAILKQVGLLFYVCFSSMFFKDDKLTIKKLIGVLMGFFGIVAINIKADGFSFNIGDVLIIAASFCTVFSNIISKKVFQTVKPITATGVSQLFGGIVLLVAGKMLGGNVLFSVQVSSLTLVYICIASIISYLLWYTVVKNGELSKLFIVKFAEPAFACLFGAFILQENVFQIQYLVAFLLIAGGIFISHKKS